MTTLKHFMKSHEEIQYILEFNIIQQFHGFSWLRDYPDQTIAKEEICNLPVMN